MSQPSTDYHFTRTQAFARLQELAREPYDLTQPGALTPQRIAAMRASACGFDLLYATQRVTPAVLEALCDLAREARAHEQ
ncbi:MAG TPA: hypothetical protein VGC20_08015, partial [bacterium]